MTAEKKQAPATEEKKVQRLTKKVVGLGDYQKEARALLEKQGSVNGMVVKSDICIALLYAANTNVQPIIVKGETKFVCDA